MNKAVGMKMFEKYSGGEVKSEEKIFKTNYQDEQSDNNSKVEEKKENL